ncbi:uncharacterized protein [Neodiprion pinetum]|uniref:uncharacterized protein n=1 Tax=Neodiprion pinetum TaxID=441929 RepID=UPI001EDD7087|nr:uncharacterized protein LOC124218871 [Neodiprion pinetum]XP_046481718.1 uncharacterized protein LOC124218871 [Neodiprion pinetum]XP_046481720.1 uncharacterized protein LOC124218871 [Neodiprion pinetum]
MERFAAVLCFCFAAQGSFAQICEPVDVLDTTVLARTFTKGALSLPVPTLEADDHLAGIFQINYAEAAGAYGRSLVMNVYEQAKIQGKVLIDVINELANEWQWSIQMMGTNQGVEGVCKIEDVMNRIAMQFQEFLSLSPGPGIPVQPPLPPLPMPNLQLNPVVRPLSPHSLFVNYNATLNEISSNIYAYTGSIFLAGWNSVWSYYDIYGLEVRNEILNDKVLEVYRRVALQINMECDFIKDKVNPALWESYKLAADRIEAEWNAYQVYKHQVACVAVL